MTFIRVLFHSQSPTCLVLLYLGVWRDWILSYQIFPTPTCFESYLLSKTKKTSISSESIGIRIIESKSESWLDPPHFHWCSADHFPGLPDAKNAAEKIMARPLHATSERKKRLVGKLVRSCSLPKNNWKQVCLFDASFGNHFWKGWVTEGIHYNSTLARKKNHFAQARNFIFTKPTPKTVQALRSRTKFHCLKILNHTIWLKVSRLKMFVSLGIVWCLCCILGSAKQNETDNKDGNSGYTCVSFDAIYTSCLTYEPWCV